MRSIICAAVMALACLCADPEVVSAQEPCAGACNPMTVPYTVNTYTVVMSPTCSLSVTLRKRFCNGSYDLEFDSMSKTGPCTGKDAGELLQDAMKQIIGQNLMAFPPVGAPAGPFYTWRISRPACVKFSGSAITVGDCAAGCCVSYVTVTKRPMCEDWEVIGENKLVPFRLCPKITPDEGTEGEPGDAGSSSSCKDGCGDLFPMLNPGSKR